MGIRMNPLTRSEQHEMHPGAAWLAVAVARLADRIAAHPDTDPHDVIAEVPQMEIWEHDAR